MSQRRRLAGLVVAAALVAVLAACGGEDGAPPGTTTEPIATETATTTETTPTTETPPPPAAEPTRIEIVVVHGAPKGGIVREQVDQGDRVVLVVRSDVQDHVHLHGYDVMRDVGPGMPARLQFSATIPGRFEVELEERGVQIADIAVRP